MSFKCVVCDELAEYMYRGFSFCKKDLEKKKKRDEEAKRENEIVRENLKKLLDSSLSVKEFREIIEKYVLDTGMQGEITSKEDREKSILPHVDVTCPRCKSKLSIPLICNKAGETKVKCPKCDEIFTKTLVILRMSQKKKEIEEKIKKLEELKTKLEREWEDYKWERLQETFAPILQMASPEIRNAIRKVGEEVGKGIELEEVAQEHELDIDRIRWEQRKFLMMQDVENLRKACLTYLKRCIEF